MTQALAERRATCYLPAPHFEREKQKDTTMNRLAPLLVAALAACQDPAAPLLARGNVLVNSGRAAEALEAYHAAAQANPKSGIALERIGDVSSDLGRRDEAKVAYAEALSLDAKNVSARASYARLLAQGGNVAGARDELSKVLEVAPTNLYARLSRGQLAMKAGDLKAALADFEFAAHEKGDDATTLYELGIALLADAQQEAAERTFNRLVDLHPESPAGWYGRARVKLAQGDRAAALAAARESASRVPEDARRAVLADLGTRELPDADLAARVKALADKSLAELAKDPSLAMLSSDPAFRQAVGLTPGR